MDSKKRQKTFKMTHLIFKNTEPEIFTESNPPPWLVSANFKWWFDDYILKLELYESIKSDFRKIVRIS